LRTSYCKDSDFLKRVDQLLELPAIAMAFLGSRDRLSIFIEPVSFFLLPRAENFSSDQKTQSLNQFNDWVTKYRHSSSAYSIYGFLSYEAFHYTEQLESATQDKFLFPAGFYCSYKRTINVTKSEYEVIINNNTDNNIWINELSNEQIAILVEFAQYLIEANCSTECDSTKEKVVHLNPLQFCSDSDAFLNSVDCVKSKVLSGDVYQANLSALFEAQCAKLNSQLFLDSLLNEKANYGAFFNCSLFKENTYIISNSPEKFIHKSSNLITAAPIKGTIPTNQDNKLNHDALQSLLNSPKDKAELAMIVDLFRNDFGKVANVGSVKVGKFPDVISLVHLYHLFTEITATVPDSTSDVDIIFSCFPSGSISGAPKYTALSTITDLEKTSRGVYCGGMFAFCNNGFVSSVAIRTAIRTKDQIFYRAGCGITIDSEPELELEELTTKAVGFLSSI
jgi:para-aminobenzoate synthetase component 1